MKNYNGITPMPPKVQAAFDKFADTVRKGEVTEAYFIDLIGHFSGDMPAIAQSFAYHARDFINESSGDLTYNEILIETYRRTFFDVSFRLNYGGFDHSEQQLIEFAKYLTAGFVEDGYAKDPSYVATMPGVH